MAKRLICVHPHASYHFGEVLVADDTKAAAMLGIKVGMYQCWELLQDLGPDAKPKEEPKVPEVVKEEPVVEAKAPEAEPVAEEPAPPAPVEEPKHKRGSKQ